jgi:NAD(P)-dependent dehydrogenase (short-subunit alcohol dehydrogenase family)
MPALVAGIHVLHHRNNRGVDGRHKAGHDGCESERETMPRLAGKTAIVTGGAKGIGRHYAQALAADGAQVMIADIADGRDLAEEIAGRHGVNSVASAKFDVSDEKAVKQLVAQTIDRFGQIDVLVNNAAYYATLKPRNFNEWDIDTWDRVMAINVRGPYLMVRHVAPHMMARRSGKIINIASGAAYKGVPRMLPYVASKGAILAFTRSLSRELGEYGIAVNSLSPGYILSDTGLENATHVEEERVPVRNSRAFKRDAYPEDLLGALVFLASSDSDFVTGQSLVVDGGSVNN